MIKSYKYYVNKSNKCNKLLYQINPDTNPTKEKTWTLIYSFIIPFQYIKNIRSLIHIIRIGE